MLTATTLADVAYRIEQMGRSGSLAGAELLLEELTTEVRRVLDSFPSARIEAAGKPNSTEVVEN